MPTIYRKVDTGAPLVLGATGDDRVAYFFEVLKAVLINGYGAVPAAGWSVIGEDTTPSARKLALTNQHTTGAVLLEQFTTSDNYIGITVYDSMADVNTGIHGKTYNKLRDEVASPEHFIYAMDYRSTNDWVIIADAHTFVFGSANTTDVVDDHHNGWFYCGEYITMTGGLMQPHAHGNFVFCGGRELGYGDRTISAVYRISLSRYPNNELTTNATDVRCHFQALTHENEYGELVLNGGLLLSEFAESSVKPAHSNEPYPYQCLGKLRALRQSMTYEGYRMARWNADAVHPILQEISITGSSLIPLPQAKNGIFCCTDSAAWTEGGF